MWFRKTLAVRLPISMMPLMASVGPLLAPAVSKQAKNASFHLRRGSAQASDIADETRW